MNSTLETTKSTLWPQSPMPQTRGTAWQWQITTLRQLSSLRADLRARLRSTGCDDANGDGDAVLDRILLAVEELASNALLHGAEPVHARVVDTADGWLIDISDGATEEVPHPAVGRDPALGGMGLYLVAELTRSRGWAVEAGRKHVWASLPPGRSDQISRAAWHGRGDDQPEPRDPAEIADGDVQLPSSTGRTVEEAPTSGVVDSLTGQPGTCPSRRERQWMDAVPFPIPSGPGRWAALTGSLFPQHRALANARRAVERDLRAAAQRQEAGTAFADAAGTTTARSVGISHHG